MLAENPRTVETVPIWIHAPVGRDGRLIKTALLGSQDVVRLAQDDEMLSRALAEPGQVGVLILTQEGLTSEIVGLLETHVRRQPPWAELPLLVLVDSPGNSTEALARLQDALPRAKLLILQRPLRASEIESATEILRTSRLRQFALRDFLEQKELLRRELNHRVKNILSTVQALYGLSRRSAETLAAFDQVFQGRLAALANVHELLFANEYGHTGLAAAVQTALAPYSDDDRLVLEGGPSLRLHAEAAQGLALITHELATNALKYGALSVATGQVRVGWRTEGEALRFEWTETGVPGTRSPARTGYGTSFVQATAASYDGEACFAFGEDGVAVSLNASLDALGARG